MSKVSGLSAGLLVDEFDVSSGTAALNSITSSQTLIPATGIDKSAPERLEGINSGVIAMQVHFDPTGIHLAVKDLPATDAFVTACFPQGAGGISASMTAKQANYGLTRGEDGSLGGPVSFSSTNAQPIAYGTQLTAFTDDFTGAADTASQDLVGASTGGSLMVHCTEFTGTTLDVDLEQSSDDAVGDPFATVAGTTLTFAAVGAQRVDLPAATTVERYVQAAVTGTFTTATLLIVYSVGTLA